MLNRGVRYVSRGMSFEYLTSIFSCQTPGRVKISQPGDAQEYKFMKYIQGNKVYNEINNKAQTQKFTSFKDNSQGLRLNIIITIIMVVIIISMIVIVIVIIVVVLILTILTV